MTRHSRFVRTASLLLVMCLSLGPGSLSRPGAAGAATLFGLLDTGEMYASVDHGVTWSVRSTLPVHDAVALNAGITSSRLYLLSGTGGLYLSTDGGFTWAAIGALGVPDAVDLAFRADGDLLVLTATGGVYRSTNDGADFSALASLTGSNYVSLAGRRDGILFALTATGEVEISHDLGVTWIPRGTIPVPDAVACQNLNNDLCVITETGTLWTSGNDGANWAAVGVTNQLGITDLTTDEQTLVGVTKEGHTYRSLSGDDWTAVGSINQLTVTALANDTPAIGGVPEFPVARILLGPPSPNPWAGFGELSLSFQLRRDDWVTVSLHDVQGRLVAQRPAERFTGSETAPVQTLKWNPGLLSGGGYIVRLTTGSGLTGATRLTVIR